jgi:hypothetical protein
MEAVRGEGDSFGMGEGEGFFDAVNAQVGLGIDVEPAAFDVIGMGRIAKVKTRVILV